MTSSVKKADFAGNKADEVKSKLIALERRAVKKNRLIGQSMERRRRIWRCKVTSLLVSNTDLF
jgi:hypothetical protein